MPVFRYQAFDKKGRSLTGVMPAADEINLEVKLKAVGLWLTEAAAERPLRALEEMSKPKLLTFKARGKKHRRELIDFCTLMSYQVKVGVPLVRALEVASQDCKDESFRKVLSGIQKHIESGRHFYEALAQYPDVFSHHFCSVVRAGEMSSKLPETFEDLKAYLEWVERLVSEVRQATLYPVIVLTVITAFSILLFTFVVPKFADLLDKLNVPQPTITKVVFSVGAVAKATWWISIPTLLAILIGIPILRRLSPGFNLAYDKYKLRIPIFGELNRMLALSRFTHNLSVLYRAGLPILTCLEMCQRGLIGNASIEKAVGEVEQDVKTGSTISEAMHRQTEFSAMLLRMVTMGETTGNLDHALDNVADYYNQIIPRRIKNIFAILEPAMMLLLIGIVGSVALAIYLPILSLMGGIRH